MKWWTGSLVLLAAAAVASAEPQRIPAEEAQRIAKTLVKHAEKVDAPQFKVEVDDEKPCGVREGEHAAMVLPDKRLSEEALARAGAEVTPVGHLWMRRLAPAVGGTVTPGDKLRIMTVTTPNNDELKLPLCLLGVRKGDDGLELLVFGKDKEPVAKLPLKKVSAQPEMPVELEAKRGDNDTGLITITLLGKYQTVLTVKELQP
jgi:hypothetical protein